MRFTVDKKGCWNFSGNIDAKGYGKIGLGRKTYPAHRLMAHIAVKPIWRETEIVAHKCDNPRCINPEHLFITTPLGNMQDRDTKGRGAIGARHPNVKLTEEMVREIRTKYAEGWSLSMITKRFKIVTLGCIQAVCERRTWKHLS